MPYSSRKQAGLILVILPTVVYGGVSILSLLINDPQYSQNELRQDLWRAGHAHAGVLLILSLVVFLYLERALLVDRMKRLAASLITSSAILLPVAYFFSVLSPDATEPNVLINLAYLGAATLTAGLIIVGVGLLRK